MDWKDIAGIVGKAAPILGTLVGGPAGAAFGGLVAAALGTANTPDAIKAAIATDPEASLKLATLESEQKVRLQEMLYAHIDTIYAEDTKRIAADAGDRDSARRREVDAKDTFTPRMLAIIITLGAISCAVVVLGGFASEKAVFAGLIGAVVGYIFNEWKQVTTYYFGSSQGSDRKTELMAKTTPAAEPNVGTGP